MSAPLSLYPLSEANPKALKRVLKDMDSEDAELAQKAFRRPDSIFSQVENNGELVGFVGVTPITETESSAWLSWSGFRSGTGSGLMARAFQALVEASREAGLRQLYAMEAGRSALHASASHGHFLDALAEAGFVPATEIRDFYMPGEDAVFLEHVSAPPLGSAESPDRREILIHDATEHEESDGAYALDWSLTDSEGATAEDLRGWREEVSSWGGRVLVMSGPSTLSRLDQLMREARFEYAGKLRDFYAPGVHENQYVQRLP